MGLSSQRAKGYVVRNEKAGSRWPHSLLDSKKRASCQARASGLNIAADGRCETLKVAQSVKRERHRFRNTGYDFFQVPRERDPPGRIPDRPTAIWRRWLLEKVKYQVVDAVSSVSFSSSVCGNANGQRGDPCESAFHVPAAGRVQLKTVRTNGAQDGKIAIR